MKTPKAELESYRGDDLRHPESFGWKGEVFVSWGRPVVTPFNKVYRGGGSDGTRAKCARIKGAFQSRLSQVSPFSTGFNLRPRLDHCVRQCEAP